MNCPNEQTLMADPTHQRVHQNPTRRALIEPCGRRSRARNQIIPKGGKETCSPLAGGDPRGSWAHQHETRAKATPEEAPKYSPATGQRATRNRTAVRTASLVIGAAPV